VERLTALEKARLYHDGTLPDGLEGELARLLRAEVKQLAHQEEDTDQYEGYEGASPRELRMVLLNAAQHPERGFLSPLAVLEEIEELIKKQDVYAFLRRNSLPGGYADARAALQFVREEYLDRLRDDLWNAVGLVPPSQIDQMVGRYVEHVSNWVKGEKIRNAVTGDLEDPDESFMSEVEGYLAVEEPKGFRKDVMARIAAWAMRNPDQRPRLGEIFGKERQQIIHAHFQERQVSLKQALEDTLLLLGKRAGPLSEARRRAADEAVADLLGPRGYAADSAAEAIRFYLEERFD
jgi:predicted Ser/Thr protein kinase